MRRALLHYLDVVLSGLMHTKPPAGWEWSSSSYPTDTPTTAAASPVTRGRRGSSPKRL